MNSGFDTYDSLKNFIDNSSFLYIIYSEYGCKIGYTKSPLERIEQIKHGLPSQECFFVGLYINDKAYAYERKLHKIFKTQRLSGEWFILNDEDINYIDTFLLQNDFKCLIKKSLIWANYLTPSIYLNGKVKVVQKINRSNKTIMVPRVFTDLFRKPKPEEIEKNIARFLTPTEISIILNKAGLKCNPVSVGKYLTSMEFERITKKNNKTYSEKGYYVIIK